VFLYRDRHWLGHRYCNLQHNTNWASEMSEWEETSLDIIPW
jgi:hypothetical protein